MRRRVRSTVRSSSFTCSENSRRSRRPEEPSFRSIAIASSSNRVASRIASGVGVRSSWPTCSSRWLTCSRAGAVMTCVWLTIVLGWVALEAVEFRVSEEKKFAKN